MESSATPIKIGNYQILRSLGKGGMGEVFLVYDPVCSRNVALKQIRHDMMQFKTMQDRFLREAHIAAQLTHPSIIPIFAISQEPTFYTMPYVEGETLKNILRQTLHQERKGEPLDPIGGSIPALIRIFLSVCQAIAYIHSKGILHRDLKPENIIIGKYGEVLILDWGLAEFADGGPLEEEEEKGLPIDDFGDITRPGKIVGTITYMAPERTLGESATFLTDIYALGVILYQLLTLRLPFKRTSMASFRKYMEFEKLEDPLLAAPYRDIPHQLADICKKCLSYQKSERYQSVQEIIEGLQNYIEGRPDWIPSGDVKIDRKEDWEFQENVLLAKHIAITRNPEVMEWVSLMISKRSFSGNTKLETRVKLGPASHGIGFLLSVPENGERKGLADGYCLWIGSGQFPACKLFRSNIEVMDIPGIYLAENTWHKIQIEKNENNLRFYLDDVLKINYLSHTPLTGTHIGVLYRDADFQMEEIRVFVGSQTVTVNCLAIPDAFLANKNYAKAISEYRRIGYCFPGRAEGREALFRAGITLLEQAQDQTKKREKQRLYLQAHEEFGRLRFTPGAPLEYLGKSLVYKAGGDIEEEIKCLELTLRKYPKHPLLPILEDHIIFRLHESSYHHRFAAYQFALLSLRHLPWIFSNSDHQKLIDSLSHHWEALTFIETPSSFSHLETQNIHLAIQLAFWLAKPIPLVEIIETTPLTSEENLCLVRNALFCLIELGYIDWARENIDLLKNEALKEIDIALIGHEKGVKTALDLLFKEVKSPISFQQERTLCHLFEIGLNQDKADLILPYFDKLATSRSVQVDKLHLWALLLKRRYSEAAQVFEKYPAETLNQESHPLFFLLGCYLLATEGKEIAISFLCGVTQTAFPPITTLLSHYLMGKIDLKEGWIKKAFYWEKMQLLRQLVLFYRCAKQKPKAELFQKQLKRFLRKKLSS